MRNSWIGGDFNVDLDNFWEGKHSSFGRVLNWQGNVVPSSWLNIVLLSINLRKIVQFTQNYFDVQMDPSGKDVLEGKPPGLDNFDLNRLSLTVSDWTTFTNTNERGFYNRCEERKENSMVQKTIMYIGTPLKKQKLNKTWIRVELSCQRVNLCENHFSSEWMS